MVGIAPAQRLVGLGGPDIKTAVHQRRIHADDLEWKQIAQRDRDVGLAAGRRTH